MTDWTALFLPALATAAVGTVGGLGGAVLLVPALVAFGMSPADAAPLGLASVVAGSVAAGERHLNERVVNHRLGLTTELAASVGAIAGALFAGGFGDRVLKLMLAVTALLAAGAGLRRRGLRNMPISTLTRDQVGEHVVSLSGAYPLDDAVVPYTARRLSGGVALMSVAGFVAGTTGASGGFIRTPALSELMHVPTKVAAATTTFSVSITSFAALLVLAVHGRVDAPASAAVVAGGRVGARLQSHASPAMIRRALSGLLVAVALVLVAST
jgi:uncharacterized membrane protein YfcA